MIHASCARVAEELFVQDWSGWRFSPVKSNILADAFGVPEPSAEDWVVEAGSSNGKEPCEGVAEFGGEVCINPSR